MSTQLDTLINAGFELLRRRNGSDMRLGPVAQEALDKRRGDVRAALADINRRMAELLAMSSVYVHGADDFWNGI